MEASASIFPADTENIPEMRALKNIDGRIRLHESALHHDGGRSGPKPSRRFHPKVVIPYHYKGQDTAVFKKALDGTGIDVRLLEWYPS